ncbi:MAG: hypothetical protein KDB23_23985, partial [Planctomycetales bacterium]|nr:hypothetical protein [Planctomycetales bacterium]
MDTGILLSWLLGIAVLVPLASFVIILLVGPHMGKRGKQAGYCATAAILTSCVLSYISLGVWLTSHAPADQHHAAAHDDQHGGHDAGEHEEHDAEHPADEHHSAEPAEGHALHAATQTHTVADETHGEAGDNHAAGEHGEAEHGAETHEA